MGCLYFKYKIIILHSCIIREVGVELLLVIGFLYAIYVINEWLSDEKDKREIKAAKPKNQAPHSIRDDSQTGGEGNSNSTPNISIYERPLRSATISHSRPFRSLNYNALAEHERNELQTRFHDNEIKEESHSYENWLKRGYQVKRGEVAAYKYYGNHIFKRSQVVKKSRL